MGISPYVWHLYGRTLFLAHPITSYPTSWYCVALVWKLFLAHPITSYPTSWDIRDADVVCQMLQFKSAQSAPREAFFGEGLGVIWFDDFLCAGDERSLLDCSHAGVKVHNCRHSEDASAVCSSNCIFFFSAPYPFFGPLSLPFLMIFIFLLCILLPLLSFLLSPSPSLPLSLSLSSDGRVSRLFTGTRNVPSLQPTVWTLHAGHSCRRNLRGGLPADRGRR